MSKRTIVAALLICAVVGLSGGSYVAWRWVTKDHPAVGVYRMEFPAGMNYEEGVAKVGEIMESDEVLRPVVKKLDLVAKFEVENEDVAIARIREKLSLRSVGDDDRVRVMYRDRSFQLAKEILTAIDQQFTRTRVAQTVLRPPEP